MLGKDLRGLEKSILPTFSESAIVGRCEAAGGGASTDVLLCALSFFCVVALCCAPALSCAAALSGRIAAMQNNANVLTLVGKHLYIGFKAPFRPWINSEMSRITYVAKACPASTGRAVSPTIHPSSSLIVRCPYAAFASE